MLIQHKPAARGGQIREVMHESGRGWIGRALVGSVRIFVRGILGLRSRGGNLKWGIAPPCPMCDPSLGRG